MKNKINILIICLIITFVFLIVYYFSMDKNNTLKEIVPLFEETKEIKEVIKPDFPIIGNKGFNYHNSSVRTLPIEYIVIHYTGEEKDAKDYIELFNKVESTHASADYFVGFNGDIYQYNMKIDNRFSWAVGGKKRDNSLGGSLYDIAKNENSISIEMSVYDGGSVRANESGWYYSEETIQATIKLVKFLMKKYNIPIDNVIRHYDVSGKYCPGIVGWNEDSGSIDKWLDFKSQLA